MRCLKTVEYLREGENNRARPHTAQSDHHCLYRELKMHSRSSKKPNYMWELLYPEDISRSRINRTTRGAV